MSSNLRASRIHYTIAPTNQLSLRTISGICEVAAEGFERPNDLANHDDTDRHIMEAEEAIVATRDERVIGFALFGPSSLGKNALELAGIVVRPETQSNGLATLMLFKYLLGTKQSY